MDNGSLISIGMVEYAGPNACWQEDYVRLSTPKLLTFEELAELEKTDEPSEQLLLDWPLNLGLEKGLCTRICRDPHFSCFLKNDKFCFCDRHALRLEQ